MNIIKRLFVVGVAAAAGFAATAADISGAGATFPYPIYAKWADAYKKLTGSVSTISPSGPAAASSRSRPRP
jgi:phosphate transport system substrate-binding protein